MPIVTVVVGPVASAVTLAGGVTTGGVVSSTVTFWVAVAELPAASVAVQVTVVVPIGKPCAGASLLMAGLGSVSSVAVAVPKATVVNVPVASAVTGPGTEITGGVVSGAAVTVTG